MSFKPFADSTSSTQLENLTIENQGERLSIYGSVQITQDKHGLQLARQLQQLMADTIFYLEQQNLPEQIAAPESGEEIDNPFWQKPSP